MAASCVTEKLEYNDMITRIRSKNNLVLTSVIFIALELILRYIIDEDLANALLSGFGRLSIILIPMLIFLLFLMFLYYCYEIFLDWFVHLIVVFAGFTLLYLFFAAYFLNHAGGIDEISTTISRFKPEGIQAVWSFIGTIFFVLVLDSLFEHALNKSNNTVRWKLLETFGQTTFTGTTMLIWSTHSWFYSGYLCFALVPLAIGVLIIDTRNIGYKNNAILHNHLHFLQNSRGITNSQLNTRIQNAELNALDNCFENITNSVFLWGVMDELPKSMKSRVKQMRREHGLKHALKEALEFWVGNQYITYKEMLYMTFRTGDEPLKQLILTHLVNENISRQQNSQEENLQQLRPELTLDDLPRQPRTTDTQLDMEIMEIEDNSQQSNHHETMPLLAVEEPKNPNETTDYLDTEVIAVEIGCQQSTRHKPIPLLTVEELKDQTGITDAQLDSNIIDNNLYILADCFDNYQHFLDKLGLKKHQKLDLKNEDTHQAAMAETLRLWKQSHGYNATYRSLVSITLELGKQQVAIEICQHIAQYVE